MKNDTSIMIISVLAVMMIVFLLIMPAFDTLSLDEQSNADSKVRVESLGLSNTKMEELIRQYNSNPEDMEQIFSILPKQQELSGLLIQLESLAAASGLVMESVDFKEIKKSVSPSDIQMPAVTGESVPGGANTGMAMPAAPGGTLEQIEPVEPYKTLAVKLKLSGGYGTFKNYLQAVEKNQRLMDVVSLSVSSLQSGVEQGANFSYTVDLRVYYQ